MRKVFFFFLRILIGKNVSRKMFRIMTRENVIILRFESIIRINTIVTKKKKKVG